MNPQYKTLPLKEDSVSYNQPRLFVFIFAFLVCNAAGCLASRLARGLAFAATAVFNGLVDVSGFDGLDSVHKGSSYKIIAFMIYYFIILCRYCQ